jgi:hypothetical protein
MRYATQSSSALLLFIELFGKEPALRRESIERGQGRRDFAGEML